MEALGGEAAEAQKLLNDPAINQFINVSYRCCLRSSPSIIYPLIHVESQLNFGSIYVITLEPHDTDIFQQIIEGEDWHLSILWALIGWHSKTDVYSLRAWVQTFTCIYLRPCTEDLLQYTCGNQNLLAMYWCLAKPALSSCLEWCTFIKETRHSVLHKGRGGLGCTHQQRTVAPCFEGP